MPRSVGVPAAQGIMSADVWSGQGGIKGIQQSDTPGNFLFHLGDQLNFGRIPLSFLLARSVDRIQGVACGEDLASGPWQSKHRQVCNARKRSNRISQLSIGQRDIADYVFKLQE